jgi:leucyl-tRNA synthetase
MENRVSIEDKWQKRWEEARLFEANRDPSKPKFFIIFAYPGVSGYLHVGHMRGYTYTDAISRYKRMRGFNVLFPVGTHASGNISINFAKKVQRKDQNWIDYLTENGCPAEQIEKLANPDEVVRYFSSVYVDEYWKKFGFLADWRRFTTTINPEYKQFISWQFKKLHQRGLLTQKPYYATFCLNCGPIAVDASETDISSGGGAEKQEYTLLKFKMDDGSFLVAATLRPETVFGQTNFWAGADITYVKARVGSEVWVLSREAAEKLKFQKDEVEIIEDVPGSELIGKKVEAPMIHRQIPVLPSYFCDPCVGTGLVTSVPSDAPADWMGIYDLQRDEKLCSKQGLDYAEVKSIQPIPIINTKEWGPLPAVEICEKMNIKDQHDPRLEEAKKKIYKAGFHTGVMNHNCGKYEGMPVEKAKDAVKQEMLDSGEAVLMHGLSEEVICRCGERVIIKKIDDQWFIRYSDGDLTERAKAWASQMNNSPEEYKKNFPAILDWFQDRACVRLGDWLGTPFPLDDKWIIEPISDSTLYPIFYLVSMYINDGRLKPEQLTEQFFDYIYLGEGSAAESSNATGIDAALLEEIRADIEYWYPLDINLGGKEHMTVHFPVFFMNHVAVLPKEYYPRGIFAHWYIVGKGSKISKSKGGAVPIPNAAEKFTVDGLRLYYCHVASAFADVEWEETAVFNYRQRINRVEALVRQLAEVDGGQGTIDEWLEARFNARLAQYCQAMDAFDLRIAANEIYFEVASDIRWYLKRGGGNKSLLSKLASKWIRMMCPITPHSAEELWEAIGGEGLASAAKLPEPEPRTDIKEGSSPAISGEAMLKDLMASLNEIIKVTSIKPKRMVIYTAAGWKKTAFREALVSEGGKVDVGGLMKKLMTDEHIRSQGKAVSKYVQKLAGDMRRLSQEDRARYGTLIDEKAYLTDALSFLEKEFGCKVEIYSADDGADDPQGKAQRAEPWSPGIYIE